MCFRNLPIEFDADGKTQLKQGLDDPWGVRRAAAPGPLELDASAAPSEGRRAVMRAAGSHAFGVIVNRAGAR